MAEIQMGDNNTEGKSIGRYLAEVFGLACTHKRFWNDRQELADDGKTIVTGPCKDCGKTVSKVFGNDRSPE